MDTRELIEALENDEAVLAKEIVEEMLIKRPDIFDRYGADGIKKCLEDSAYHLQFLREALAADDPEEFRGYRAWLEQLMASLNIPNEDIDANFRAVATVLTARWGADAARAAEIVLSTVGGDD